jgi:cell division inhibitor SepF
MGFMKKIMTFIGLGSDEEYEDRHRKAETVQYEEGYETKEVVRPIQSHHEGQHQVVPLQTIKTQVKLILAQPHTYEEAQKIADHMRQKRIVLLHIKHLNEEQLIRTIDFLNGTKVAVGGKLVQIGAQQYLIIPETVDVQGKITL